METRKIRTLIEVDRKVWSQTKAYASLEECSLSEALGKLLTEILSEKGYKIQSKSVRIGESNGCKLCH